MQDLAHQFDIKPNFSNQYMRPCIPRSFNHDFIFGANHLYQMKFPPLQSDAALCPHMKFSHKNQNTNLNPNFHTFHVENSLQECPKSKSKHKHKHKSKSKYGEI